MPDEISAGKISIDFGADLSSLHQAFAEARRSLNDLGGSLTKGTGAMGDFGTATSVAGGILGAEFIKGALSAAKTIASFAFTVTESASTIVEGMDIVAQQTGLTLQQMQELEPVFRRNNLSAQSMGQIFRILARNINEARDPTSQAGRSFRELGIVLTGLETPSQVFSLIAERISQLPSGFQRTRLETELLGRSGIQLNAVLAQGAEGLRRSAAEARAMGNVLNTDANNALLKVNDSFDDLATASSNLQKHLAVLFSPFVQAVNEASIALIHFATNAIDHVIIATRTLAVRFEALFGFLRAQAQLSVTDWAQIPEIWERWNHWAVEQIDAIRQVGVVSKETANSVGQIDEKAQAAALAMQRANDRASLGLTQVDMGWQIVEKSLATYRLTQKAVVADGAAAVAQFDALDDALRSVAEASDRAALAAGSITGAEFAANQGARAVASIKDQIAASQELGRLKLQELDLEMSAVQRNTDAYLTLEQQKLAASTATALQQEALIAQLRQAELSGIEAVATAQQRARETDLTAMANAANAEVRILEGQFATTETLRAARLTAIQANLDRELAVVGLTEAQKTAILRTAEAERINVARQYPTFFQKQMQDLVASNAFSLSQITTNFTAATAQWIVTGQNFKAFWTSLQTTIVQAFLNGLIQMAAQWILQHATMQKATAAFEAAKTAIFGTGEQSRLVIAKATSAAMTASMLSTLGTMAAIGQAAISIAVAAAAVIAKIMLAAATAAAIIPGGQPIAGALIAGATALAIGSAAAAAIGTAAIQTAIGTAIVGSSTALAFQRGGIVTGPTFGLMGEGGAAEAAIPLNERGAKFLQQAIGFGSRGGAVSQTIIVDLAGEPIMKVIANGLPSRLRLKGLPA